MKAPLKPRVLAPVGNHIARVSQIIYIGTVPTNFGESYKVRITWELPTELHKFKDGEPERPFVVSKEMGLTVGKKSTLRPFIEGIIGTSLTDEEAYAFDIDNLLGQASLLNVVHEKKETGVYETVKSASPLPKGIVAPNAFNEPKILSFDKWDQELFDRLPTFIQDKIKSSKEYMKMKSGSTSEDIVEYPEEDVVGNDMPF